MKKEEEATVQAMPVVREKVCFFLYYTQAMMMLPLYLFLPPVIYCLMTTIGGNFLVKKEPTVLQCLVLILFNDA